MHPDAQRIHPNAQGLGDAPAGLDARLTASPVVHHDPLPFGGYQPVEAVLQGLQVALAGHLVPQFAGVGDRTLAVCGLLLPGSVLDVLQRDEACDPHDIRQRLQMNLHAFTQLAGHPVERRIDQLWRVDEPLQLEVA